jgi:hypothetical protein
MSFAQRTVVHHRLYFGRKAQEPQQVRDGRAIAPDHARDFTLRHAELVDEALVSLRLVDRREVVPLQVLDERERQQRLVVDLLDDGRHVGPA